jgi:hypothetical protein
MVGRKYCGKQKLWFEENFIADKAIMGRGKYHGRQNIMVGGKNIKAD